MQWVHVEGAVQGTPDSRMGMGVPQHPPCESDEPGFWWPSSRPSDPHLKSSHCVAGREDTQVPFPASDNSHLLWPPRNQILLREASHACSSIWARGVKNAAAIKNPINFQPLVRAAGLSTVGGVLSVINLSPLCRALICSSDERSSGR